MTRSATDYVQTTNRTLGRHRVYDQPVTSGMIEKWVTNALVTTCGSLKYVQNSKDENPSKRKKTQNLPSIIEPPQQDPDLNLDERI